MSLPHQDPRKESVLMQRLEVEPCNTDVLFTLAAISAIHRRYESAIKYILKLETVDPRYPGLWRLKSKIYELMGDALNAAKYWQMGKNGFT